MTDQSIKCVIAPHVSICIFTFEKRSRSTGFVKIGLINFYSKVLKLYFSFELPSFPSSWSPITEYFVAGISSICFSYSLKSPNRIIPIYVSPIQSANVLSMVAVETVVNITTKRETVIKYGLFLDYIWRERANAMTPRMSPQYHSIFLSAALIGIAFLMILCIKGRMIMLSSLITGMLTITKTEMPIALA